MFGVISGQMTELSFNRFPGGWNLARTQYYRTSPGPLHPGSKKAACGEDPCHQAVHRTAQRARPGLHPDLSGHAVRGHDR